MFVSLERCVKAPQLELPAGCRRVSPQAFAATGWPHRKGRRKKEGYFCDGLFMRPQPETEVLYPFSR
ncbi:MAG: hypothetical protein CSA34_02360 [Desulfobulbus propionicus]|nr:MAG: hypothetical protein CSA34_02360 [Desulfobulbus propionicus]